MSKKTEWTPENIAAQLRWKIPADPVVIARSMGIQVLEAEIKAMSALINRPGYDPIIMINSSDSTAWRRWATAIELGYYIAREDYNTEYEHVSSYSFNDSFECRFAAELLLPANETRNYVRSPHDLSIPDFFGVPHEIVIQKLVRSPTE